MHNHNGNSSRKWMMWICVLAPVLAIGFLFLNNNGGISIGRYLPYAVFLICPLMHFAMMGMMHKKPAADIAKTEPKEESDCH